MNTQDLEKLVKAATGGSRQSMDELAAAATPKVRAFLYRVALRDDVADDLTQETLLQMVSSLGELRSPESFWPWMYRIAMNKANQHFRQAKKEPQASLCDLQDRLGLQIDSDTEPEGHALLKRRELAGILSAAIQKLRKPHRAVIAMRCFDDMPYKHIAESLNCSELAARVTFVRAKKCLKKELARNGLKSVPMIGVLVLFGRASVEPSMAAQVSVASASMETSLLARTLSAMMTKKAAVAAAGAVLAVLALSQMPDDTVILRDGVNSVHYIVQARDEKSKWGSLSKGAYEKWCYFPDGPDGPMILRMQRWDPGMQQKLCSWLQDEYANHYYNPVSNTVYLLNERLGGFLEMPTDTPQMAAFIEEHEPRLTEVQNERFSRSGLMMKKLDNRFEDSPDFETVYDYNMAEQGFFEPHWPGDVKIEDLRTPMHKRGWTYFRVEGRAGEAQIEGSGRMPFYLAAAEKNPPWLEVRLAGGVRIIDGSDAAWVMGPSGEILSVFEGGTFFRALGCPWMGYSILDSVRRDAAAMRIPFETFFDEDRTRAEVVLDTSRNGRTVAVVYRIDLLLDLLESIRITAGGLGDGKDIELTFRYLQEIDGVQEQFSLPATPAEVERVRTQAEPMHWLVALGADELVKN